MRALTTISTTCVTAITAIGTVGATATGEPAYPQRSAVFSIRRYKKKSFTFPYVKDKAGTFTTVRIGVMDRSGGSRMTYNVPVEVQVGAKGSAKPAATSPLRRLA